VRSWAIRGVGGVAAAMLVALGLGLGAPAAQADGLVCLQLRANSPGTFLNLDQTECQNFAVPDTSALPLPVPLTGLPNIPLPDAPVPPGLDASSGLLCLLLHLDVPGSAMVIDQHRCLPFNVPATGLPAQLTIPFIQLPPLPIPAIPLVPPVPIPIQLPIGGLPYPL
jgi:hypothetical protein